MATVQTQSFPRWNKIRELLSILAELRDISEPWTSADGLHKSLDALLRLAELVAVDPAWTGKLRDILHDPGVFAIVLAIVQYVSGSAPQATAADAILMAADGQPDGLVRIQSADFAQWLPLVIQLIHLLRELRPPRAFWSQQSINSPPHSNL